MNYVLFIQIGGVFHLICAFSHLFFPKTFHWEENLRELPTDKKKKIKNTMYLSNTCTLLFWLILSYIPMFYAKEILETQMGRAILTLIVLFWTVRIFILQPVFASYKTREFWVRTLFFLIGFIVFLIPWIAVVLVDCSVSKNVISFDEKYRTAIYELDKEISGENRELLLKGFLESSMLYVENGKVVGYYMPGLKEGLIFADTKEAGLELMKLKYSNADKAALPVDNVEGVEFLKQKGFVETTTQWTRMVFGKDLNWNPQKIFGRIGGNFG